METRASLPPDYEQAPAEEANGSTETRRTVAIVAAIVVGVLLLIALVIGVVALVRSPGTAESLRDTVIVLIGIQSVLTGAAVIILLVQMARLTALLQNEVRPMLEASNETLRTVRGTTEFLSDRVVRPVVRFNGAMAAVRRALELVGLARTR